AGAENGQGDGQGRSRTHRRDAEVARRQAGGVQGVATREEVAVAVSTRSAVAVERLDVSAYEIPTDEPESDGTLEWDSTTIVVVEAHAGNETGLGYTYGPAAAGKLVEELLAGEIEGADAFAPDKTWERLVRALRNAARAAIGDDVELYVDSNGALGRNEALAWAHRLRSEWNVTWFEEPVPSADLDGLRLLCRRAPAGLDIVAGEYGYVLADFQNLVG